MEAWQVTRDRGGGVQAGANLVGVAGGGREVRGKVRALIGNGRYAVRGLEFSARMAPRPGGSGGAVRTANGAENPRG